MAKIEFNFKDKITIIDCQENDMMDEVCKKFASKVEIDINNIYFLYLGKKLDFNKTFNQVVNNLDKTRKTMSVLVNEIISKKLNINIIESSFPICPLCCENSILEIKDYKINLQGCKNGHSINNILINEYEKLQKIKLSKIACNECKTNNENDFNKEIYICNICKKNLCSKCNQEHDKSHKSFNYESKNFICKEHNEIYTFYCRECKKNLCSICKKEKDHLDHDIIELKTLLQNKDNLLEILKDFRINLDIFNNNIDEIISIFNSIKKNIEIFYKIYYLMINKYTSDKNINYEILMSLNNFGNNNNILKKIKEINLIENIIYKIDNLLEIYAKLGLKNYFCDEITMIYNIDEESDKIKIFDKQFINNNINNCKLICENKEYDLIDEFDITKINKDKDKLELKLKGINKINNMECMFYECNSLEYLPDINKWNTNKITNMSFLFYGCSSLKSLPDISKWDTSNVIKINSMFSDCILLESLPDISIWNTKKIIQMNHLFYNCLSLKSLPDISKWNTDNVITMQNMFTFCQKLESLPELSRWHMKKVQDVNQIFYGCTSLKSLPHINKWFFSNINNMQAMFGNCSSLISLPDISKWNTSKVIDMSFLFSGCSGLKSLPDISKWNTMNVNNMECLFAECKNLEILPGIDKWNTNNVSNMRCMFYGCSELKSLPDIYKWNIDKVVDKSDMFTNCLKLNNIPQKFI